MAVCSIKSLGCISEMVQDGSEPALLFCIYGLSVDTKTNKLRGALSLICFGALQNFVEVQYKFSNHPNDIFSPQKDYLA